MKTVYFKRFHFPILVAAKVDLWCKDAVQSGPPVTVRVRLDQAVTP